MRLVSPLLIVMNRAQCAENRETIQQRRDARSTRGLSSDALGDADRVGVLLSFRPSLRVADMLEGKTVGKFLSLDLAMTIEAARFFVDVFDDLSSNERRQLRRLQHLFDNRC